MEDIFYWKSLTEVFLKKHNLKLKDIAQSLRTALSGKDIGPDLFEMMAVLGEEEVIARLEDILGKR